MQLNTYQQLAHQTSAFKDDEKWSREHTLMATLGLCGEAGEVADTIKKVFYHNHGYNSQTLIDELGDVLWYLAELCTSYGFELGDIADSNIAKLKQRYGNAFSSEASINRNG